jgi:hypothetical protein
MQFFVDAALTLFYFLGFLLLCTWAWRFWMMYINQRYLNKVNTEYLMLEIKLPREIFKSPLATEVAISSLLQTGSYGNWYQKYFQGNLPMYSSLEIASIEGVIHFYIRTQKKFKPLVESNFYAQYPGIEIVEVEDYTKLIRYDHRSKDVGCWGEIYGLTESWKPKDEKTGKELKLKGDDYKMPADFLPIKTYVDFGLDRDPKEEFKIDPLTPLLEMMGTLKKGEYLWYQIILQDESLYDGKKKLHKFYLNKATGERWTLSEMAEKFKKQIRIGGYIEKGTEVKDDYGEVRTKPVPTGEKDETGKPIMKEVPLTYKETKIISKKEMELTVEEKGQIEATNKKFAKPLAVVVMRMLYLSDNTKAKFNADNIQNILSFPRPFAGANKLGFRRNTDPYDYEWENFGGKRKPWRAEEIFEDYVERQAFYPHIPFPKTREGLEAREDRWFWSSPMKTRKTWRMFYEAIFHPFFHPEAEDAFTLNLEEIATLWHLPGAVATTPALPRIDSAKGMAPVNLPQ